MELNNRQVITAFAIGITLLLIAFWAGMSVRRGAEPGVAVTEAFSERASTTSGQSKPADQQQPQTLSDSNAAGRFLVVVATVGTETQANEMTATLRRDRYLSTHVQHPGPASGSLFRVVIGPYSKREDAELVQNELLAQGRKGVTVLYTPAQN